MKQSSIRPHYLPCGALVVVLLLTSYVVCHNPVSAEIERGTQINSSSVRPEDDYYYYANKKWLADNDISEEFTSSSSFMDAETANADFMTSLWSEKAEKSEGKEWGQEEDDEEEGEGERTDTGPNPAFLLYRLGVDDSRRGLGPTFRALEKKIDVAARQCGQVGAAESIAALMADLYFVGIGTLLTLDTTADLMNASQTVGEFSMGGLGMPSVQAYTRPDDNKNTRSAYHTYLQNLTFLHLASAHGNESSLDAEKREEIENQARREADIVMALEDSLAPLWPTPVERRNFSNFYHPMTMGELKNMTATFPWDSYLSRTGELVKETNDGKEEGLSPSLRQMLTEDDAFITVYDPYYLKFVAALLHTVNQEWHGGNDGRHGEVTISSPAAGMENKTTAPYTPGIDWDTITLNALEKEKAKKEIEEKAKVEALVNEDRDHDHDDDHDDDDNNDNNNNKSLTSNHTKKVADSITLPYGVSPCDALIAHLRWSLRRGAAPYHSPEAYDRYFTYAQSLTGVEAPVALPRRVYQTVLKEMPEQTGREFVKYRFTPEAKQAMKRMTESLKRALRNRIKTGVQWMGNHTKQEALTKLEKMGTKIGYPDVWQGVEGASLVEMALSDDPVPRASMTFLEGIFENRKSYSKFYLNDINSDYDKSEWSMSAADVNAYYSLQLNEIVFPAGILQPPFFKFNMSRHGNHSHHHFAAVEAMKKKDEMQSEGTWWEMKHNETNHINVTDLGPFLQLAHNYGAIGAIIGHEITHGFDSSGRQFDANGERRDWWAADDEKHYLEQAKKIEAMYDRFHILTPPGDNGMNGGENQSTKVNGKLTLDENIADIGGIRIALDAFRSVIRGRRREILLNRRIKEELEEEKDGGEVDKGSIEDTITDAEKSLIETAEEIEEKFFFRAWADTWKENKRPQAAMEDLKRAVHSPVQFRTNGPLSLLTEFQDVFDIEEGDGMYVSFPYRGSIW